MNESLKIECEWWGPSSVETDITQACRGAIGIRMGDHYLTRLEDTWGNTIRNRMNVCAHTLGEWFAINWWRLRWEPETARSRGDVDWRMAHSMGSAGGGFCWPSLLFASDGEMIAVTSRPTEGNGMGPVRFLSDFHGNITARDFEREIDAFMTMVLSRLDSEGYPKSELAALWAEVVKERGDPKLTKWRRLEAICGYDPDEAPELVIEKLTADEHKLGTCALEEVAAQGRHETMEVLEAILKLAKPSRRPHKGGFPCSPPVLKQKPRYTREMRPWERAKKLAHAARKEWQMDSAMVSNKQLSDCLQISAKAFADRSEKAAVAMPLALRDSEDGASFYFNSARETSRRFAATRLLGHWLEKAGKTERLIPATEAKTSGQQFQRAFAQEFLCPFDELMDRLPKGRRSADDIDDAAAHFGVSPLMVRTTLVNHGQVDRETLFER